MSESVGVGLLAEGESRTNIDGETDCRREEGEKERQSEFCGDHFY